MVKVVVVEEEAFGFGEGQARMRPSCGSGWVEAVLSQRKSGDGNSALERCVRPLHGAWAKPSGKGRLRPTDVWTKIG
jgi:hypothetical protein